MEENQTPGKQDMVDRKAAWVEKIFKMLFAAVKENPSAALLVLSVLLNIWQFSINNEINQLRIKDITSLNEKINAAVERRVDAKMVPIQAQQDSVTSNIDTSLTNLNGIVNSIKQSIKSKK